MMLPLPLRVTSRSASAPSGPAAPPGTPTTFFDFTSSDAMTLDGSNGAQAVANGGSVTFDATAAVGQEPIFHAADATYNLTGRLRFRGTRFLTLPSAFAWNRTAGSVYIVTSSAIGADLDSARATFFNAPGTSGPDFALLSWDGPQLHPWNGGFNASGVAAGHGVSTQWMIGGASNAWVGSDNIVFAKGSSLGAGSGTGARIGMWTGTNFPYDGDILAVVYYAEEHDTTERNEVLDWAATRFGSPPTSNDTVLIFDGDSLTEGIQGSNPQHDPSYLDFSYPSQVQRLRSSRPRLINSGNGGAALQNNTAATDIVYQLARNATMTNRVVFGLWGRNDEQGGRTGAQLKADLDTWIASIRAADAGAIIGHGTILPASSYNSPSTVTEFNAYVLDETVSGPDLDFRIDTNGIAGLQDPSDTDVFVDGTHPTSLGYSYLAAGVNTGLIAAGY